MKVCSACLEELGQESFSKKQWQLKMYQRRCRECIHANRASQLAAPPKEIVPVSDDVLFQQPAPNDDCPICCLPLPLESHQSTYSPCCGNTVCKGCSLAVDEEHRGNGPCPFCRSPKGRAEEVIGRIRPRAEAGDVGALYALGVFYKGGTFGLPQDYGKAMELWLRGAELGSALCHSCLGFAYGGSRIAEENVGKSKHHYELAAVKGDTCARNNLGSMDIKAGNTSRAAKHFMIAARAGHVGCMAKVSALAHNGVVSEEELETTVGAFEESHRAMKSLWRDRWDAIRAFDVAVAVGNVDSSMERWIVDAKRGNLESLNKVYVGWKRGLLRKAEFLAAKSAHDENGLPKEKYWVRVAKVEAVAGADWVANG